MRSDKESLLDSLINRLTVTIGFGLVLSMATVTSLKLILRKQKAGGGR